MAKATGPGKYYKIVQARSLEDLDKTVNTHITRSYMQWHPLGSVFTYNDVGIVYCQPMVKRYNRKKNRGETEE